MVFHERVYDAFVILGKPHDVPLWNTSRWHEVASGLDELIRSAEGPVAVRSTQLDGPKGRMKPVAFGRIGWNKKGHDAWTLRGDNTTRLFGSTEVWGPSWTRCELGARAPDLFFALHNPAAEGATWLHSPVLLLAAASDLDASFVDLARATARATAGIVGAVARACQRRPWGYSRPGGGFDGSIQDLHALGAFDQNWVRAASPSEPKFGAGWTVC
jgi:hypothetical protein